VAALTLNQDGVEAVDLGVVGECQYALGSASVWRRKACEVGTYGGWRWECDRTHPARHASVPLMAELAERMSHA
jgi:hypothetical protein